jgi:hypothetical protein
VDTLHAMSDDLPFPWGFIRRLLGRRPERAERRFRIGAAVLGLLLLISGVALFFGGMSNVYAGGFGVALAAGGGYLLFASLRN